MSYILYLILQKGRIKDAAQRYQYALKKFPKDAYSDEYKTFREIKLNLMLNLSRCRRKLNVSPAVVSVTL